MVKLDKKGKQRILASLAKDLGQKVLPAPIPRTKPVQNKPDTGTPRPGPIIQNPSITAPAGSPAAKPKVVRGGKAKVA